MPCLASIDPLTTFVHGIGSVLVGMDGKIESAVAGRWRADLSVLSVCERGFFAAGCCGNGGRGDD